MEKHVNWIDCGKCVAIFAVMVDHTNGVLYTNPNIAMASYFSVSLFVLISGMMSFISDARHNINWLQTFIRSSKNIVIAYLIANIVYIVYIYRFFDLRTYLQYVIGFNLSGPFYYVLLYLQLMLVSRILYSILSRIPEKMGWVYESVLGVLILYICYLTTNYTNVLDVYGGGGRILGGTYLFLFYLGMLISKHDIFGKMTIKKSTIFSIVGFILWFVWWRFECIDRFALDMKLPFGWGFNPPSITSSIMAVIVLILSSGVFSLLEYINFTRWITYGVAWIGKHTLYIFLYHRFFLDWVIWKYCTTDNMLIKRIVYFMAMIFGSIALDYLFHFIGSILSGKISFRRIKTCEEKSNVK